MLARKVAQWRSKAAGQRTGPIGVDFALESVHLVQLEVTAGSLPVLRAKASVEFDGARGDVLAEPHRFRSLMRRALETDRFQGRDAIIAVPSDMFRTMSINYRCGAGEKEEDGAVLKVMKERVDGNLEDYVLDYLPVKSRTKNDERLALVAISERKAVLHLLELARKSGLDVAALEIGPVAISRLVSTLSGESDRGNVLVINSGRRASYLTLLSGSDLLFDQEVAFGETALIDVVAETLDMTRDMARGLLLRTGVRGGVPEVVSAAVDEAAVVDTMSEILKPHFLRLVEEIKRVCLYAAAETRGGGVTGVYLLGSIARWPGSDGLLGSMTGVEITKMPDPLSLFVNAADASASAAQCPAPELAVATGLALRGLAIHG